MLTFSTAAIYVTLIIVNFKSKKDVTIDLSLMIAAMIGDVILAIIIW